MFKYNPHGFLLVSKKITSQVDIERLYQHLLTIEGIKNPLNAPSKLNETADYIKTEFEKYGLKSTEHRFTMEGFDIPFRNIETQIGDGSGPELLITSHYDTTLKAPGADDNGSAVAGMLECARILAQQDGLTNIRFVSFTMEEMHPTKVLKLRKKEKELGLTDQNDRPKHYHSMKTYDTFFSYFSSYRLKRKAYNESIDLALEKVRKRASKPLLEYIHFIKEIYSDVTHENIPGECYLIGSNKWVEHALDQGKDILGVLNLEMIGYTSNRKGSQRRLGPLHPLFFPTYKVKPFKNIGNFIAVVTDKHSKKLGKTFFKQCKRPLIKLPCFWVRLPFNYDKIVKWAQPLINSDHAPFWRAHIPATMITDTAFLRNPFYHTAADTIDKLDFNFMKKVTQATIATTEKMIEVEKASN